MSSIYLIDHYSNSIKSIVHGSSVRSKLLFLFLTLTAILLSKSVYDLVLIILVELLLIKVANLPLIKLFRWSLYAGFFASLFAMSQLGHGYLPLQTLLKAEGASLLILLIICTTPYTMLFSLFNNISTTLASTMFLTYRFFFLMVDEMETKIKILKIRGGYSGGIVKTMKNLGMVMGQTFITCIDKSQRIYSILSVRGFAGKVFSLKKDRFRLLDSIIITAGVLILITVIL